MNNLPIGALVEGLVVFNVILGVGSPLASKSQWLARFLLGYAYIASLFVFWLAI